jgi:glycerophosphoryl diester phosphodiesterase
MQKNPTTLIAHRGASAEAPENTLAAFDEAWTQEADGIEGDFRMTRDGEIVCVHDATLDRTGGDTRAVADHSLEELHAVDVGAWKGDPFRGERMPTLARVLSIVPAGKSIYIEIKSGPEIVPALVAVLDDGAVDVADVIVISFQEQVLADLKAARPLVRGYLLSSFKKIDGAWEPTVDDLIGRATRLGVEGLGVQANPEVVDAAFASACRKAGLELNVWTVDQSDLAGAFIRAGVTSLTTNRPGRLREELR